MAQIVAALSVTYTDEGVALWLKSPSSMLGGDCPMDRIAMGLSHEVADLVREVGDSDPEDFTRDGMLR